MQTATYLHIQRIRFGLLTHSISAQSTKIVAFQIDAVEREPSMMITTILYCFTSFKTSFSFRLGILLYFFLSLPWLKTTLSTYQTYGYLILNIRLSLLPSFFPPSNTMYCFFRCFHQIFFATLPSNDVHLCTEQTV